MTQKKVTITDIAKAAGVSKTTISRYLNGRFDLMSPETRRRIESVIDVSGYQPSTIARSLKNKRSLLLGIVVSDQSSPFSTAVLLGVGDALRNTEYVPVFVNCDDDPAKERYQISFLLSRGVDGLIVNTTSYENPFLVNLEARGVPIVLCDRYIKGHTFDIVTTDHASTIQQLLAHLKGQGYGLPALFCQRWDNNSVRLQRRQAFLAGAEALFGLRPGEAPVYEVDGQNPASAVRALEDLMARCAPGQRPAVIGVNSVTTTYTLHAMREMGLAIPQQIGLCGPEDWNWGDQMNWPELTAPQLTTASVHAREIGATATHLLLARIADPSLAKQEVLLPSELSPRASTLLSPRQPDV